MNRKLFDAQIAQYATPTVSGEGSITLEDNIRCYLPYLKIDGNTFQFQGDYTPPAQDVDLSNFIFSGNEYVLASDIPVSLPNNLEWKIILTKIGSEESPEGFTILIGETQDALLSGSGATILYSQNEVKETPVISVPFYIGVGNTDTGIPSGDQGTYETFFKNNFKLEIQVNSTVQVPCPQYSQPIENAGDGVSDGDENITTGLPVEYQEVEYIESTGTQYIDTGFVPNQDTRVVCDFQLTETYASFVFGARAGSGVNNPRYYTFNMGSSGNFVTAYNSTTTTVFEWDLSRHIVDKNKNVTTLDNTSRTVAYATFTSPKTLTLFACNQSNVNGYLPSKMKLYSCQMYDNGTLIRDFIPCYRIGDNSVGLYDLVSGVFYTNTGTGEFVKGANVEMSLELRGKNLFDLNDALVGSNWYYIGGTISYPLNLTVGKQYTISANTLALRSEGNYSCSLVRKTGDTVFAATNLFAMANSLGEKEYTFTADGTEYLWGYRDSLIGSTAIQNYINEMLLEYVENIQIEQGSTATEYEAYFNTTIAIPASITVGGSTIPLRFARVEDKADYIEVNRLDGTVKYIRNIAYLKMPHADSLYSYRDMNGVYFYEKAEQVMTRAKGICTHTDKVGNYTLATNSKNAIWVGVHTSIIFWVGILDILGLTTLAEFNTWLDEQEAQGTPVELIYQLKTPVTTNITSTDLGQTLLNMITNDGTITILVTSSIPPTLTAKYLTHS